MAEQDGWVWIWIGKNGSQSVSTIPSFPYFDTAKWAGFQKYFHVQGAAQLFVDNLLDLSHLAFTHKSSIGSSSSAVAEPDMEVSVEGDVVRGRRYIYNVEPGPLIVTVQRTLRNCSTSGERMTCRAAPCAWFW